jgi:hypothetical protein
MICFDKLKSPTQTGSAAWFSNLLFYDKAFSDIFYLKIAGFLRFLVIDGTTLRSKIVHALKLVIF